MLCVNLSEIRHPLREDVHGHLVTKLELELRRLHASALHLGTAVS